MNKNKKKELMGMLPQGYRMNLSDFALFLSVMRNKRAYE